MTETMSEKRDERDSNYGNGIANRVKMTIVKRSNRAVTASKERKT